MHSSTAAPRPGSLSEGRVAACSKRCPDAKARVPHPPCPKAEILGSMHAHQTCRSAAIWSRGSVRAAAQGGRLRGERGARRPADPIGPTPAVTRAAKCCKLKQSQFQSSKYFEFFSKWACFDFLMLLHIIYLFKGQCDAAFWHVVRVVQGVRLKIESRKGRRFEPCTCYKHFCLWCPCLYRYVHPCTAKT